MRFRELMSMCASLGLAGLVSGCQPPPPAEAPQPSTARVAAASVEEAPQACDAHFEPKGDLPGDLGALVRSCSLPHREHELAPAREDHQGPGDAVQRYAFTAEKDHCYRVYAVGDADVIDIDVQLVGPDGRMLASDATHTGHVVVPSSDVVCARASGVHTIEVSVARGSGRYAMQVWTR